MSGVSVSLSGSNNAQIVGAITTMVSEFDRLKNETSKGFFSQISAFLKKICGSKAPDLSNERTSKDFLKSVLDLRKDRKFESLSSQDIFKCTEVALAVNGAKKTEGFLQDLGEALDDLLVDQLSDDFRQKFQQLESSENSEKLNYLTSLAKSGLVVDEL